MEPTGGSASPGAVGWTQACSSCRRRSGETRLRWWLAMHACLSTHLHLLGDGHGQGLQLQAAGSPMLALDQGWPVTTPACSVLGTP